VSAPEKLYGLMAEFDHPERLVEVSRLAREQGYRTIDAYSPFPVEGLDEALGERKDRLPLLVLLGGIGGGLTGFGMQYFANVIQYPLIIGGRPYNSWPSFIPVTFELTILGAALVAVLGMLALNGLPTPYHPVFSVPRFELASRQAFFLCIESRDPKFDFTKTKQFLESLKPVGVYEVAPW
jgi:hypothetical protein